nr:hypothetical protein [Tanacetum cinerariifolium]
MVNHYGRSFHCLYSLIILHKVLNNEILIGCPHMIQSMMCEQNVLRSLVVSSPLVFLANVVSSTGGVVAGEAMGDGTVRDAGETSKESDDYSGDAEVWESRLLPAGLARTYNSVQSQIVTSTEASYYCFPSGAASLPSKSGPLSFDSSLSESIPPAPNSSTFVSNMYLLRNDKGDRVIASITLAERLGDNGVVESDRVVDYDEVILVSDGSEAAKSSLVRRETGVESGEVGVWSDDGGAVLVASG